MSDPARDLDPVARVRPILDGPARNVLGGCGLAVVLAAFLVMALGSAHHKSVTVDELGHLPSGLYTLAAGDVRHATLNPPLINVLSALPVLWLDLDRELAPPQASDDVFSFWSSGYHFLERHRADYLRIYQVARVVPVLLVTALGVLLFVWARQLAPESPNLAGLLAAGLVVLSPNVIAHARIVGTDTGTAYFIAAALFSFRAMLVRPAVSSALVCGVVLGLALLSKFYALLLYPALLVTMVVWYLVGPRERPRFSLLLGCYAGAVAVSMVVLNAGYLFAEFARPLSSLSLSSPRLGFWQTSLVGSIPLPLPGAFVRAVDGQLVEVGSGLRSFLMGESFQGGRWDYYLLLLGIKTPLVLFSTTAFAIAGVFLPAHLARLPRREVALLLTYPVLLFSTLSLAGDRQLGARALLSAVPLVQLWVAVMWVGVWPKRFRLAATGVALLLLFAVSARAYPDYLSYFNPLIGGSEQGYRYASDANVDIGQDLVKLSRYLEQANVETVQLLYFGSVDPALYGIDYTVPSEYRLEPGLLAISVSLYRMSYEVYDHGTLRRMGPVDVSSLGPRVASIGDSIHVYRMGVAPPGEVLMPQQPDPGDAIDE
jgi:hypothetical protein